MSLGAVDAMTLRLSMRRLGSPKDRLMSSKMRSAADVAAGVVADEASADEVSEASTSNELP